MHHIVQTMVEFGVTSLKIVLGYLIEKFVNLQVVKIFACLIGNQDKVVHTCVWRFANLIKMKSIFFIIIGLVISLRFTGTAFATHDPNDPLMHAMILPRDILSPLK